MSDTQNDDKPDEKQHKKPTKLFKPISITNKIQYEILIRHIHTYTPANKKRYVSLEYYNPQKSSEYLNYLIDTIFPEDEEKEKLFTSLKAFYDSNYIDEKNYEWVIRDPQPCYFVWLYLKVLTKVYRQEYITDSLLFDKLNQKTTGHLQRKETLIYYFISHFKDYHQGLIKLDENKKQIPDNVKNKSHFLVQVLDAWQKYFGSPDQFKWLFNDPNGENHKLIWDQLCSTVPFLQNNEYNLKLEKNKKNRNQVQDSNAAPIPKVFYDEEADKLIVTDIPEMRLAIHATYCVWISFIATEEEVKAFRKRITDAIYMRNRRNKK